MLVNGILEHFPEKKLVSGSGVNLKRHTMEPYPEGDTTIFLYVGRMMREKGTDELLAAAKAIHDEKTQFWLLGYPDEDYAEKLQEAEKDGRIKLLAFDPDVHGYLKKASAVVLPSYHEGMSNVLMEASATGRPVITTTVSGCKEVFEEGVTGFGCQKEDSADLIRALKKFQALSAGERAEMGRRAREKMEREFDREKVADAYLQEINTILEKRG